MRDPVCSLSLDLDNQWSYMKTHGDAGWDTYPSYLDVMLPYAIDLLAEHDLRITFFIVGQDAARRENHDALRLIATHGHTVGNHSFNHEPWLHLYAREEIEREVSRTEEAIKDATGLVPRGFRGPGYSWSTTLLEVLVDRGYLFDASTLPTFIGPLARLYYFWTSDFDREERQRRKALFGRLVDGFMPLRPYSRVIGDATLLEIPVTTMPVARVPFHLSYLIYLSRVSTALMMTYLRTTIAMCRMLSVEPSFLLHPLDLLGGDQVPELRFFPGMDVDAAWKRSVFDAVIGVLRRSFRLVDMYEHAATVLAAGRTAAPRELAG